MHSSVRSLAAAWVVTFVAVAACAQQPAPTPSPVWVNLNSGVYHCPGTEHYGTTARGEYLAESAAIAQGFRASGGNSCNPALASAPTAGPVVPAAHALPDSGPPAPDSGLRRCIVSRIHDGDTIRCRTLGTIRLIGIDSPELNQPPYGAMATDGLKALIALGDTIQLSTDREPRDRYGRLLGYLWRGGTSVNFLMVREGWAVSLEYPPNTRYASWFAAAESLATAEQAGLWKVGGFQCRPSKHRAGLC
jgi:endonuclease YncB( thermonuclease family)